MVSIFMYLSFNKFQQISLAMTVAESGNANRAMLLLSFFQFIHRLYRIQCCGQSFSLASASFT